MFGRSGLTDSERAAVHADGFAEQLGDPPVSLAVEYVAVPTVTEPAHRLTALPAGIIGAVVHDKVSFEQAMADALPPQVEAPAVADIDSYPATVDFRDGSVTYGRMSDGTVAAALHMPIPGADTLNTTGDAE